MSTMRILLPLLLSIAVLSCSDTTVVEDGGPPIDPYHGDLVGRVIQKNAGAMVYVNQIAIIDSAQVNPADGTFAIRGLRLGNYDLTIVAPSLRIYKRANVQVPGGGIGYLGDIDLSKIPDLIDRYYPADQAEIVVDGRFASLVISILFTQPMDRESVEQAFSTDPPSTGIFYWGEYAYSPLYAIYQPPIGEGGPNGPGSPDPIEPGAKITTFSKITAMTYMMARRFSFVDTTYTFRLSTAAHDTAGNHLRFPHETTFRTIQSRYTVYGIQTDPEDGDIGVSLIRPYGLTVTFPRRMDETSTEAALSMTPDHERIVIWPEGNVMNIYLGGILHADTRYSVTIDSTAQDRDGIELGAPFTFSFDTAPVQLRYAYPRHGQLFVRRNSEIGMDFNTYIIKSSVESAFSIDPAASGTFVWAGYHQDSRTGIVFKPSALLQANRKYTVTVDSTVEDLFGDHMPEPYTFQFITEPE